MNTNKHTFTDLLLSEKLVQHLASIDFTVPTEVQQAVIPFVLMGKDIVACAQTGTGKTASFALPMIDLLAHHRSRLRMPRALVLVPTRELAAQVSDSFERFAQQSKLAWVTLIGGTSIFDQEKKLARGVDIIIATPGRFLDLVERGNILLSDLKYLVIDEADRMLDMGFIPDVEKIFSLAPYNRQVLLFSATLPDLVKKLINQFLVGPKQIEISAQSSTASTIEQYWMQVEDGDKLKAILWILRTEAASLQKVFIFCNRKKDVDTLNKSLQKEKYNSVALHGDMHQLHRTQTLQKFKEQSVGILVASDIAARGIDIESISHVISVDVPMNLEDYVHRIGRTGRAGKSGKSFIFLSKLKIKHLKHLQAMANQTIKEALWSGQREEEARQKNNPDQRKIAHSRKARPALENLENAPIPLGFGEDVPRFFFAKF